VSAHRDNAVELLRHYITLAANSDNESGTTRWGQPDWWNGDNETEVAEIVDNIIAAAADEIEARVRRGTPPGKRT